VRVWSLKEHTMINRGWNRRALLQGVGLTGAAALIPASFAGLARAADTSNSDLSALAETAVLWGYPLVLTGRYVQLAQKPGFEFNQFYLDSKLATPSLKVAGPNIDTIYGFAWIDLSKEPVILDVPDTQDRYYSIQLLDAYENTFAYVGRRATGTRAGTFVLTAPGWKGQTPKGATLIASPTTLVFALTRTLVRSEQDAAVASQLQQHYTLAPLSAWPHAARRGIIQDGAVNIVPVLDLSNAGSGYFDELDGLVRAYPPTGKESEVYASIASLGIGSNRFRTRRPADAVLQEAFARANTKLKTIDPSEKVNGWRVNYHVRPFIADPGERAATNRFGPGAHVAAEALYFSASTDRDGAPLSGQSRYELTFPAGQLPPVDAFWSLILYGQNFFLVDNPINRYGITDRTAGLRYGADGSLTLSIQNPRPVDQANWLPAPQDAFQLILRTYQPRPEVLNGNYKPPSLQRV
jgi:hypothetical protein